MTDRKISRALLSVSDKTGLIDFAKGLARHGVALISTGGTAKALRDAGLQVQDVSDITNFPEMMDGRVKTLHPNVHGGLLALRDKPDHAASMQAHGIEGIDLLVCNLYPFEATVARGADFETTIENIDIGGPAMTRSAAKNHDWVTVGVDVEDYKVVAEFDPKAAPACAIIKHANPCGVALGKTLKDAYLAALACDTQSAFGGVLAFNTSLDGATAEE